MAIPVRSVSSRSSRVFSPVPQHPAGVFHELFNNAAAETEVAGIEDGGLTGGGEFDFLIEKESRGREGIIGV